LKDLPWYQIAGNHDHYGDVRSQIKLSQHYARWNFPDLSYDITFNSHSNRSSSPESTGQNYSLQLIAIDTAVMAGLSPLAQRANPFPQPTGPFDSEASVKMYQWLEDKLKQSTADYVWVIGHYPVYSLCWQGGTVQLLEKLQPLLRKYGAHYMVWYPT
jgi:tartrate-resistant acid phosphatase type 5